MVTKLILVFCNTTNIGYKDSQILGKEVNDSYNQFMFVFSFYKNSFLTNIKDKHEKLPKIVRYCKGYKFLGLVTNK